MYVDFVYLPFYTHIIPHTHKKMDQEKIPLHSSAESVQAFRPTIHLPSNIRTFIPAELLRDEDPVVFFWILHGSIRFSIRIDFF